jgi:hypothetical protein
VKGLRLKAEEFLNWECHRPSLSINEKTCSINIHL